MKKNLFLFILSLSLSAWTPASRSERESKYILKETKKAISSTFKIERFLLEQENILLTSSAFLTEHSIFKINTETDSIGYAIVATAPSKTDSFEYLLLLDSSLSLKKVKVLIYREDYGGEISSKRWLSQFLKSDNDDNYVYGDNISAISGATISVKSITASINDVMDSIRTLQSQNKI
jgi:Na+-translocating ferredoxin:NAD+ oxidoreductase RnfG subunit